MVCTIYCVHTILRYIDRLIKTGSPGAYLQFALLLDLLEQTARIGGALSPCQRRMEHPLQKQQSCNGKLCVGCVVRSHSAGCKITSLNFSK